MTADLAIEAALDLGDVLDVVDVAVGEQQHPKVATSRFKPIAGPLRGVEQNPAFCRRDQVAVGFENAAAKRFIGHLT